MEIRLVFISINKSTLISTFTTIKKNNDRNPIVQATAVFISSRVTLAQLRHVFSLVKSSFTSLKLL